MAGYNFAGVEFENECFCGGRTFERLGKVDDGECNMRCPGDTATFCGGNLRISVYEVPPGKHIFHRCRDHNPSICSSLNCSSIFLMTVNSIK